MRSMETVERPFIKGLRLAELFYKEAVRPILAARFPDLAYSAALLGRGSEVLGFDTPQSMDHDWGPRLMLFLKASDKEVYAGQIDQCLRRELPPEIHGYPTSFTRQHTTALARWDSHPLGMDNFHGIVDIRHVRQVKRGSDEFSVLRSRLLEVAWGSARILIDKRSWIGLTRRDNTPSFEGQ